MTRQRTRCEICGLNHTARVCPFREDGVDANAALYEQMKALEERDTTGQAEAEQPMSTFVRCPNCNEDVFDVRDHLDDHDSYTCDSDEESR